MAEICFKCFNEYDGGTVCPVCAYDSKSDEGKYPHALKPGSVLGGRYIVGRVLGQGGFGITYAAQDYDTKQLVAIKEYLPEQYATRIDGIRVGVYSAQHENDFVYGKENFLAEAKTLSQFNGIENICDIYSYFEENGTAYFAMEYVEGTGLDKYMRENGRLSYEQAQKLLVPVMEALSRVHEKGIIHRDISPDNIMLRKDGRAMLIDFGAARYSMGEKSRSLDVILKHGFAPKEQYTRRGRQGAYTDVYAMAATFYYAITGKVPPEAIDRIDADELMVPSTLGVKLPGKAEAALIKALSVNAESRYQHMMEFAAALENSGTDTEKIHKTVKQKKEKQNLNKKFAADNSKKRGFKGLIAAAVLFVVIAAGIGALAMSPLGDLAKGWMHYSGIGAEQDYGMAMDKFVESADRGNSIAMTMVGLMYHNGDGVEKDYYMARKWYEKGAELNEISAVNNLGVIYHNGDGVARDYAKAMEYYLISAELGNPQAMRNVAAMYEQGKGLDADYDMAREWYMDAARLGYESDSEINLKILLQSAKVWLANRKEAIDWRDELIKNGHAEEAYRLGLMYHMGADNESNYSKALEWYELAASMDHPAAMNKLGAIYELRSTDEDDKKAFDYYQRSAQLGDAEGMYNLGRSYAGAIATQQDFTKAFNWYSKAADEKQPDAINALGELYRDGKGVEQNIRKAELFFNRAAKLEHGSAIANLGKYYYDGLSGKADYNKAFEYYNRAMSLENSDAMVYMAEAYLEGKGVYRDRNEAYELLMRAQELGNSEAMYLLGEIHKGYYDAGGVYNDRARALSWYEKSAGLDNPKAMIRLGEFYYLDGEDGDSEFSLASAQAWFDRAAALGVYRE